MGNVFAEQPQREQESRESHKFVMENNERTLRILHRISLRTGAFQQEARRAFMFLQRQIPGKSVDMQNLELGLSPEILKSIENEVNRERLLYGEETPERKAFLEQRADVQKTVREMRAQGYREWAAAFHEQIPDQEKQNLVLFQEANAVLQNVAREMGIKRTIVLKLTRGTDLNAFVLQTEKEGTSLENPSEKPLHVYVAVGLFSALDALLQQRTQKRLAMDHFAGIIAHELQHLRQPAYNMDKPPEDKDVARRFEYDSDLVAMDAMDKAGYNPMAFVEVFQAVQNPRLDVPERMAHYFKDTHPLDENRIKGLLAEFHRPERVFFSSDVIHQPFSESVYEEIGSWDREYLREQIQKAVRWSDWEQVVDLLERDPRATFVDAEITVTMFKIYLEARAALSAAAHELRTGELGLLDALLYSANARVSGKKNYLDIWHGMSRDETWGDGKVPKYGNTVLSTLAVDSVRMVNHEDPGLAECIDGENISKLIKSIYIDTLLVPEPFPDGPFHTVKDLTDPYSDSAQQFWKQYYKANHNSGRLEQVLPEDFSQALTLMVARLLWRQESAGCTYRGEEVKLKAVILKNLGEDVSPSMEAALQEAQIIYQKITQTASASLTSSHIKFAETLGALANRLTVIRGESERLQTKKDIQLDRGVRIELFTGLFAQEAAGPDVEVTQATRDRIAVQNRLLAVARKLFDRDVKTTTLPQSIEKNPQSDHVAQEWMFTAATSQFLFPSKKSVAFPVRSATELETFGVIQDYFRVLPTSLRRLKNNGLPRDVNTYLEHVSKRNGDADHLTTWMIGRMISGNLARKNQTFFPEDVGDRLNDTRLVTNNPLTNLAVSTPRYTRYSSQRDRTILFASEKLEQEIANTQSPLQLKKALFRKWVLNGLEQEGQSAHAVAKNILRQRSGIQDNPVRIVPGLYERVRDAYRQLTSTVQETQASEEKDNEPIRFEFSFASAELYSSMFADDYAEMYSLAPNEVSPFLT